MTNLFPNTPAIGDRLRFRKSGNVWEITTIFLHLGKTHVTTELVVAGPNSDYNIGHKDTAAWIQYQSDYEYIPSKASHFTSLYSKLTS